MCTKHNCTINCRSKVILTVKGHTMFSPCVEWAGRMHIVQQCQRSEKQSSGDVVLKKRSTIQCVEPFVECKPDHHQQGDILCTQCFSIVVDPHSNMTNPYNHLRRHHKIRYELAIKEKLLFCCQFKANKCLRHIFLLEVERCKCFCWKNKNCDAKS